MTRPFKTILLLFIFLQSLLVVGQTKTADSLFEKSYLKLKREIDTTFSDAYLRDSLFKTLDSLVIKFFKDQTTFNYSFKILEDYSVLTYGQLRVLTMDARNGGSFHQTKTFIQYKGTKGKIGLKVIDGTATGETEDNLGYTNLYLLKPPNLYLLVGSGTGCNSCFFYGARAFEIQGDSLLDYPAFNDKSCFIIDTDNYDKTNFHYASVDRVLSYIYMDKGKLIEGFYIFNWEKDKFVKKTW